MKIKKKNPKYKISIKKKIIKKKKLLKKILKMKLYKNNLKVVMKKIPPTPQQMKERLRSIIQIMVIRVMNKKTKNQDLRLGPKI